ncbi:hypothetical protein K4F52_005184 [Lecanicillium sp. MT-2017a]|nr:hypothetical protein K4F52_005184 [Lecanicillium sp. MT-2017a]
MTRRLITPSSTHAAGTAAPPPAASRPGYNELMAPLRCLGISPSVLRSPRAEESDEEDDDTNQSSTLSAKKKKKFYTIVTSDLLIPGDGDPIADGALVVEAKTIVWVGTRDAIPAEYTGAAHKAHHVPYIMPGLWDVHLHFAGASLDPEDVPKTMVLGSYGVHPASQGARLAKQCWQALQMGYTSMRDCGGFGCEMAAAINDGSIVGPNVYGAGAYISQTAGHGDQFDMPPGDVLLGFGVNNIRPGFFCDQTGMLADGADECRRAVRLQVRRGAKCIKILATGGITSLDDDPRDAQFCDEEMFALVDESNRMGRAVAAHCHAKAGIIASIKAGVTTIEHGSYADEECIDLMKKHDIIFVPTRCAITLLLGIGDELPKKVINKVRMIAKIHWEAYKMAVAKGVTIAMGTDIIPSEVRGLEIQHGVEAGMTNLQALKAATATAPLTLGRQAPKSGQLKVGYDADILGLTENPTEDVKVLQKGENIKWVWKGGKLFKGPNVGPWGEE